MDEMLKECEHDVKVIEAKLRQIKKQPKTARRDAEIVQWETMLYDVLGKAAQIRKYLKVGEDK